MIPVFLSGWHWAADADTINRRALGINGGGVGSVDGNDLAGAGGRRIIIPAGSNRYVTLPIDSDLGTTWSASFWFQMGPGAGGAAQTTFAPRSSSDQQTVNVRSIMPGAAPQNSRLAIYLGNTNLFEFPNASAFSAACYRLEVVEHSTSGIIRAWRDNDLAYEGTNLNTSRGFAFDRLRLASVAQVINAAWYSHVAIGSGPVPEGLVLTGYLKAASDLGPNGFTKSNGALDHYEHLEDTPHDGDTTYLASPNTNAATRHGLETPGISGSGISHLGARLVAVAHGDATLEIKTASGSEQVEDQVSGFDDGYTVGWGRILDEDPDTDAPWTSEGLGAAEAEIEDVAGSSGTRLTSLGIEYAYVLTPPDAPEISVEGDGGTVLFVTTTQMLSADPEAVHTETLYQVRLQSSPNWNSPPVNKLTADFLTEAALTSEDGVPASQVVVVRAFHIVATGAMSPPSNEVTITTGPVTPTPDQGTLTEIEKGEDNYTVELSAFSHPDGSSEEWDPENPLPYPLVIEFRYRQTGDTDWITVSRPYDGDRQLRIDGLDPNTSYQNQGRYQDGLHLTSGPWSATLTVTTDPIPPNRPDTPDATLVSCAEVEGGSATIQSSAFVPHEEGGQDHAATDWFAREGPTGNPIVFTVTSGPGLLEFTFPNLTPGEWFFYHRHRDSAGNNSLTSTPVSCVVAPLPPTPEIYTPHSGAVIATNGVMEWRVDPEDPPLGAWEYTIRRRVGDGAFQTVSLRQAGTSFPIDIAGVPDGSLIYEVRTCYPSGGACGYPSYLVLQVDRTGVAHGHIDFTTLDAMRPGWAIHWGNEHSEATLVEPSSIVDVGLDSLGLQLRNTAHSVEQTFALVFPEFGKPIAGEFTTVFAIEQPEVWFGWRFAHSHLHHGGLAYRVSGQMDSNDRGGVIVVANAGRQPWYLWPQACQYPPFPCFCDPCTGCRRLTCAQCRGGLTELMKKAHQNPNAVAIYGVAGNRSSLTMRTFFPGQSSVGIHQTAPGGILPAGGERAIAVSLRPDDPGFECRRLYLYTMRSSVTREVGGIRIRAQVLGPGLDPDQGWRYNQLHASIDNLPCGFCGVAIWSLWAAAGMPSLWVRSFSASNLVYEECAAEGDPQIACPDEIIRQGDWTTGVTP